MAFWKKKSHPTLSGTKELSQIFSFLLKNYYYSLSEQNVGSCFTGKTKVNTIWSSLSSLTLASQKGISFRSTPSSVTPHPPWVILPFLTTFPSVCVSHCSFPAGSFSYVFFSLRPCFLEPRLACLIDLISIPDVLPHLPSSGITGARKHTCCFTCFDCFLPLTWNN